jgi:delta 1-pyrroline-5-carboxylate dehydrogenase
MSCMTEETFGPTLPVMRVADETEAIRLANDSDYGLSATVWTGNKQRGERVARQPDVGAVNINDAIANAFSLALPLGGWKQSGVGARFGGAGGMLKYCRQQAITCAEARGQLGSRARGVERAYARSSEGACHPEPLGHVRWIGRYRATGRRIHHLQQFADAVDRHG